VSRISSFTVPDSLNVVMQGLFYSITCVRVQTRVSDPDPHYFGKLGPDQHSSEKLDPDPHIKIKLQEPWTLIMEARRFKK
jgi:hypothetical protein